MTKQYIATSPSLTTSGPARRSYDPLGTAMPAPLRDKRAPLVDNSRALSLSGVDGAVDAGGFGHADERG